MRRALSISRRDCNWCADARSLCTRRDRQRRGPWLPFSAWTRVFSYLGWPAAAAGDVQVAGRDAQDVIAVALALERAGAVL